MQETQFRSLGRQDTLEKEMATHSCILAWIIPWTEQPGRLQSMGSQRVGQDLVTKQQQQMTNINVLSCVNWLFIFPFLLNAYYCAHFSIEFPLS